MPTLADGGDEAGAQRGGDDTGGVHRVPPSTTLAALRPHVRVGSFLACIVTHNKYWFEHASVVSAERHRLVLSGCFAVQIDV